MKRYDSIVIGLGAMGSAAAAHLAGRGQKVLGLEQFTLGHDRGSSHGETRLIRQAYFENADYVPLLLRAYDLWDELAAESREELFVRNGLLIYGRPESSKVFQGALRSGRLYSIPMEELAREPSLKRWPMYRPPEGFSAAFEPGAGYLRAEACTLAHAGLARNRGAELLTGETVLGYSVSRGVVRVRTANGEYESARLVLAGGAWSSRLLAELGLPLTLRRMLLAWFKAGPEHRGAPGFIFDLDDDFYYGFPQIDGATFKIAGHHGYQLMDKPEEKDIVAPGEDRLESLRRCIGQCFPFATKELVKTAHCIYTMTPDEDFVMDRHPLHPEVVFAAGFSGHGFKFASVVGEILADLAENGRTAHPIEFLRASRFRSQWPRAHVSRDLRNESEDRNRARVSSGELH
ncbi:MAG: N-methyl-L-tryptophan oxidase [Bdellovibrionota bacterium]